MCRACRVSCRCRMLYSINVMVSLVRSICACARPHFPPSVRPSLPLSFLPAGARKKQKKGGICGNLGGENDDGTCVYHNHQLCSSSLPTDHSHALHATQRGEGSRYVSVCFVDYTKHKTRPASQPAGRRAQGVLCMCIWAERGWKGRPPGSLHACLLPASTLASCLSLPELAVASEFSQALGSTAWTTL